MTNELEQTLSTNTAPPTDNPIPTAEHVPNDSSGTSTGLEDKGGEKLSDAELEKMYEANLLKKLGVDSFDTLKNHLSKFNDLTEAQKTEEQKRIDRLEQLENSSSVMKEENFMLNAKLNALTSGVQADSVDDVIILAKALVNDETDIVQAIQKVTDKYPQFRQSQSDKPKPTFATKTNTKQELTDNEQVSSILLGRK